MLASSKKDMLDLGKANEDLHRKLNDYHAR